jgi:drug/metabolite transporter, DME family
LTERERGALAAAVAGCMFGSSYVATAFQLDGVSPIGGALWRSALGSLVLIGLLGWGAARGAGSTRDPATAPPLAGRLVRLAVLGLLGGLLFITGMNVAVSRVGATVTAFVAGLYAVLAALFAPALLGERLARRAVVGFAVALVGTALLAELSPSAETLGGLAAGAGAAVSYGLFLVLIRRWSTAIRIGPIGVSFSAALAATVGLGVALAILSPASATPTDLTGSVLVATAWLAIVSAFGPLLVATALRRVEARVVSSFLLLNPITATALAALLLDERPSPIQLLGGLLVLIGIGATTDIVGAVRRRRQASAEEIGLPIA